MSKYRYEETFCSQCGEEFGPGDHGYSHCSDHQPITMNNLAFKILEELNAEFEIFNSMKSSNAHDLPAIDEWLDLKSNPEERKSAQETIQRMIDRLVRDKKIKHCWLNINNGEFSDTWDPNETTQDMIKDANDNSGWKLLEYHCINQPEFTFDFNMKLATKMRD